jgi:hypothetical protein
VEKKGKKKGRVEKKLMKPGGRAKEAEKSVPEVGAKLSVAAGQTAANGRQLHRRRQQDRRGVVAAMEMASRGHLYRVIRSWQSISNIRHRSNVQSC